MAAFPFRIALRIEGKWWVAYVAKPAGMAGALEIARVRYGAARHDPAVKQAFIEFAQLVADSAAEALGLAISEWDAPKDAPENEKAGNA